MSLLGNRQGERQAAAVKRTRGANSPLPIQFLHAASVRLNSPRVPCSSRAVRAAVAFLVADDVVDVAILAPLLLSHDEASDAARPAGNADAKVDRGGARKRRDVAAAAGRRNRPRGR
jgi:hypothetical protein